MNVYNDRNQARCPLISSYYIYLPPTVFADKVAMNSFSYGGTSVSLNSCSLAVCRTGCDVKSRRLDDGNS